MEAIPAVFGVEDSDELDESLQEDAQAGIAGNLFHSVPRLFPFGCGPLEMQVGFCRSVDPRAEIVRNSVCCGNSAEICHARIRCAQSNYAIPIIAM